MALQKIPAAARREIGVILFIAMEAAWISVLYNLAQAVLSLGEAPPLAWTVALYPATYLFVRMEREWRPHPLWKIALRTALGFGSLLFAVAVLAWPDFLEAVASPGSYDWEAFSTRAPSFPALTAVGALFALLRGGLLGSKRLDSRGFLAGFQLGIGVLFVIVFGQHLAGFPVIDVLPGVVAFFGFGLYGLGAERWLRSETSAKTASQAGWPVLGLGIIGLILAFGAVFWAQFDQETVNLLLVPVFWLWEQLVRLFLFFVSLFPKAKVAPLPAMPQMPGPPSGGGGKPLDLGFSVREISRVVFIVSLAVILAAALLRNLIDLLRWMNRRLGQSQGISYEHSSSGLLKDLRDIFSLLAGIFSGLLRPLAALLSRPDRKNTTPETRAIRRIYRRLLIWADKRGWPKPAGQTPYEFLESLRKTVPHLTPDLVSITDNYVAVRYGAAPPDPDVVRRVRASWRRVRKAKKRKSVS